MATAKQLIEKLRLERHPEGGWFRQTFADVEVNGRPASTAIHYLLEAGEVSHWHRVTDAAEVWHFHAGSPLVLSLSEDGKNQSDHRLGADVLQGDSPHVVVPRGWWQSARSLGDWTLVSCTVAPGFVFESFEMAPPDWAPGLG